ncbi:hypothetical protein ATCC90586_006379 [Pythium insidiosum]|nr:hypothetical protein ATCC90586_006379 [Pythium insidiosum]
MANGDAEPGVAPFCVACRRSSEVKWKKHIFTNAHQRAASEFLLTRLRRLEIQWEQLRSGAPSERDSIRDYCAFCEQDIVGAEPLVQHFASASHKARVHAFCKHHRCDARQELRSRLCLRAGDYHELMAKLHPSNERLPVAADAKPDPPTSDTSLSRTSAVEEFLVSAASQLERVEAQRGPATTETAKPPAVGSTASLLGPRVDPRVKIRTLTSPDGVLQNPLGIHDGARVWGGGIVKVRKTEWLAWGIDLLVTAELEGRHGDSSPANDSLHRVTERAHAHGLASVPRVAWGEGVANVHSACAVPPWMVNSEAEYKTRNQRALSAAPKGDIFARMAAAYDEKTWLPNFGSVWQDGPRAKTRAAFQQLSKRARKPTTNGSLRDRAPAAASSLSDRAGNDRAGSETSDPLRAPASPPSQGAIQPEREAAAPSTQLDEKKRALLAQKARLRARLAAKRQS